MPFIPKVDGSLNVMLPGEQMRTRVTKVVDRNTVFVELGQPMMRTHTYRRGDIIACRRTPGELGETWVVIELRPAMPSLPELKPNVEAKMDHKPAAKTVRRMAKISGGKKLPKERVRLSR